MTQINLDFDRIKRTGLPEFVFSEGKSLAQLKEIVQSFKKNNHPVVLTRLKSDVYNNLKKSFPTLKYNKVARVAFVLEKKRGAKNDSRNGSKKLVAVITAGTCDTPVGEEASQIVEIMGVPVKRFYDCGVAGLHRILKVLPEVKKASAIICVAGMEGALASVVAGLVDVPVIGVPTSVGYGAAFDGVAPLLTMLNSCAPGVSVVNIDAGFSAACVAVKMINA